MSGPLDVHVLALDPGATPAELRKRVADVTGVLGPADVISVVGPRAVAPHPHRPVTVALAGGDGSGGPLAPLVRMVRANLRSRAAWRALRADAEAMRALRGADLVVVVDTLGQRSGWMLARRHGVRAVTGNRALRHAAGSR